MAQSRVQRQAVVMASIEWVHFRAFSSLSSGSCSHTSLYIVPERTRIGRQPYLFCAVSDCVRLLSYHQTRNVLEITTLPCYERGYKLSAQRQKKVGRKIKGEKGHEGSLLDEVVTAVGGSHFVKETKLLLSLSGRTDDLGRHRTH